MSNAPRFVAWCVADFDDATLLWPVEAVGAYVRLLHYQYRIEHLPTDVSTLSGLVRMERNAFEALWVKFLRDKFVVDDDNPQVCRNLRMAAEREKAARKASQGRKAVNARWEKARQREAAANTEVNTDVSTLEHTDVLSMSMSKSQSSSSKVKKREDKLTQARDTLAQAGKSVDIPEWVMRSLSGYCDLQEGRSPSLVTLPTTERGWALLAREAASWGPQKLQGALDLFASEDLKRLRNAADWWEKRSGSQRTSSGLDQLDQMLSERGVQ